MKIPDGPGPWTYRPENADGIVNPRHPAWDLKIVLADQSLLVIQTTDLVLMMMAVNLVTMLKLTCLVKKEI